jgi:hypothetical protein
MSDNQGSSLNAAYDTASGYVQQGIAAVTGTTGNQVSHYVPPPATSDPRLTVLRIHGTVALTVTFCIRLGIYLLVQRRKRLRNNPRDVYKFEMVGTEDDDEVRRELNGYISKSKLKSNRP